MNTICLDLNILLSLSIQVSTTSLGLHAISELILSRVIVLHQEPGQKYSLTSQTTLSESIYV